MNENQKSSRILGTNILFMVIAILLITLGSIVQSKEIYTGVLITEYLIILAPILILLKLKGYSIKETLRLNPISFKQAIMVILIVIVSYPVAVFLNSIGIIILDYFTEIKPNPVPIPSEPKEFAIGFLVIALSPGICEEVMFRGLMMNSYRSIGKKKAIIYSAVLFGIFHFNLQNLLGPIYLGILFGMIFYKTNSLYSTIIGHTTNNTIALIIGRALANVNEDSFFNIDQVDIPSTEEMIISLLILGVIVVLFGLLSYKLIKLLPNKDKNNLIEMDNFLVKEELIDEINQRNKLNIFECFPIIVVLAIFIVLNYLYFFV